MKFSDLLKFAFLYSGATVTEIYVKIDTETKRAALDKAKVSIETDLPDWKQDESLMAILK